MKKVSVLILGMMMFIGAAYAQSSSAHITTTPGVKTKDAVTFPLTLDNINDVAERDSFTQKLKATQIPSEVTASAISSSNQVTYQITMAQESFFKSFEGLLGNAGIKQVYVNNEVMDVKGCGPKVKAEYEKANSPLKSK